MQRRMMFWILAAMLTALVTAVLMFPLARAARGGLRRTAAQDGAVYRDQLGELERDVAGGILAATRPTPRAPRSPAA